MSNRFQEAKRRIASAPETYFPGGKWENGDYFFSRRADDKTPSTHIVPDSEQVKDFGDPDYRGSVLDCYAEMQGLTAAEAVDKILGPDLSRDTKKAAAKPAGNAKKKPVPKTPIPPEAAEALAKRAQKSKRGHPVSECKDLDQKGEWRSTVIRFEDEAGKKSIIPYYMDAGGSWREGLPFSPRPLYNLPEIIAAPDTPVLIVEGEKCASVPVPGFIVATWSGGTSAVHRTDWEPLKGRKVLIWPDADEVGRKAADQIQVIIGGETEVMEILEPRPQGWDIADAASAGMTAAGVIGLLSGEHLMRLLQQRWLGLQSAWHLPASLDGWYYALVERGLAPLPVWIVTVCGAVSRGR